MTTPNYRTVSGKPHTSGSRAKSARPDQHPPATDVILHLNVPCGGTGPDRLIYLEIDKLADGAYRATVGTLFEHQEICRTHDLEAQIRQANAMARWAMRTLG